MMKQNNFKLKKIGAYLGILSIFCSNIAVAMQSEQGQLVVHARKSLQVTGHPQPLPVVPDIASLSYEDFDITAHLSSMPFPKGIVWSSERKKFHASHLDTNIPYINGSNPTVDYDSLRAVPDFIEKFLGEKVHPSKQTGAEEFFKSVIIPNQQAFSPATTVIPDTDCLYYKSVSGIQHLFLRLSSATRKEAELFKQKANGKTMFNEHGEIKLLSDGSMTLKHPNMEADKITIIADRLLNRASKMRAKWAILLRAKEQRHETVINKWVRECSGKHHFAHSEGVESVDVASFIAQEVIQEGEEVENYGIFVEADKFEDRATHTVNMPAKITLVNYAWEEDEGLVSSASSSVRQVDDFLQPTYYRVNYYRSASDKEGSSVKFGYTIINSGSKIEVLKDVKEDIPVEEQHTIEIHEETSGFSICGGISVPDPTIHLQKLHAMHEAGNTIGLTTEVISAVAKGIANQTYKDYKTLKTLAQHEGAWTVTETQALLQTLSHYVHGPSIQFGSRSVDMTQQTTVTHGNTFVAPTQTYDNPVRSSFAGTYLAKDMDIKTKTFVTFDLPQTMHNKMSMHQSGVSMDLLSFAIALVNPAGPMLNAAMKAALAASSVTFNVQEGESYQQLHKPTVIQADRLNIEAESGHLTQTQIKAGIIHAIFTEDLVLKTLANEKWECKKGSSFSFGLGAFANFKDLASTLKETVASANISHIDSGHFEKIIDEFASMVGTEEFYLRVGRILRTQSAFLGHVTHDPAHEHIEAKERHDTQVEEYSKSHDRSFELSIGDLITVVDALKSQIRDEAIADGATPEEANVAQERFTEEVQTEKAKVEETAEFVERSGNETIEKVKTEIGEAEVAKLASKQPVSPKTCQKVGAAVSKFKKDLIKERDKMNLRASMRMNPVEEASLRTRNEIFNEAIAKCDAILTEVGEIASNAQTEMRDLGTNAKLVFGHPVQQTALQTRLEMLNEERRENLRKLDQLEASEKVRAADEAVLRKKSKISIWADPSLADGIKNEAWIRRNAEDMTRRAFQQQRDCIEAEYRAQVRHARGEGFVSSPQSIAIPSGCGVPVMQTASVEELNTDENRMDRLRQEELWKIGESRLQRAGRWIPGVGSWLDYHYDRISGGELAENLMQEAAIIVATKGVSIVAKPVVQAGLAKFSKLFSKSAVNARFAKNLSEGFKSAKGAVASTCKRTLKSSDGFLRLGKPGSGAKNPNVGGAVGKDAVKSAAGDIDVSSLKMTKTVEKHFYDFTRKTKIDAETGITVQFRGESSRPYVKSAGTDSLIKTIMEAEKPILDPQGVINAVRWDVPGTFRGTDGMWELVIKKDTNEIIHFHFKPNL